MKEDKIVNTSNVERFTGFAETYDQYRPIPPKIIIENLINYIGREPSLVVDLGSGTGLSTFIWSEYSKEVVGVEPNRSMIDKANESCKNENVSFILGYGNDTKLGSGDADIVTCSSSFQWMEPNSTIHEISRILADEGVFAIYNPDQPPTIDWVVEKAYRDLFHSIYEILDGDEKNKNKLWTIEDYLIVMRKNSNFRFIREFVVHSKIKMTANDVIGLAESQGAYQKIVKENNDEINMKITDFKRIVKERLKEKVYESSIGYRIRIAIK